MAKTSEIVEFLRAKMIRVAAEKQSFTDPEVVAISQLLDQFIVQAQRVASAQKPASTVVAQPVITTAQSFAYGSRHGTHLRAVYSRN